MLCIVNFAGTDKKAEEEIRWLEMSRGQVLLAAQFYLLKNV